MAHSSKEYMREYMRKYREKKDLTTYMQEYRERKKAEQEQTVKETAKIIKKLCKPNPTGTTNFSPPTQTIFNLGEITDKELEKFDHKTSRGEKEKILNLKIRIDPLYQTFSPEKQKEIDEAFLKTFDLMDVMFVEKVVEVEQYTKMRFDQWAEKMLTNIKKLVEVSHSQKHTEIQTIEEENKNK